MAALLLSERKELKSYGVKGYCAGRMRQDAV